MPVEVRSSVGLGACISLEQIPLVAIEVAEYNDRSIRLLAWLLFKLDIVRLHVVIVAPEVACFQEQEHSVSCLTANVSLLLCRRRLGEQQRDASVAFRRDNKPPLAGAERSVFYYSEAQHLCEERGSFIVFADNERYQCNRAVHGVLVFRRLTFELSGPPPDWPARRNDALHRLAGQAGGGPLERRVRRCALDHAFG